MTLKGVFFDFGFVIGYPKAGIDRRYFYLDWDGIGAILKDPGLVDCLRASVGRSELEAFFEREIYRVFIRHEQTDLIDPQVNSLLLDKLSMILNGPINQLLVDQVLVHIDTMKYITVDRKAKGILRLLKKRGYRLAIVSNMMLPGKLLRAKLQQAHILDFFDDVTVSSDVGFIKPHPGILHHALNALKLTPDEGVFVGDTYYQDIIGAKRVGMKTVWLNTRHEPLEPAPANLPDFEIEQLAELTDLPIFTFGEAGNPA